MIETKLQDKQKIFMPECCKECFLLIAIKIEVPKSGCVITSIIGAINATKGKNINFILRIYLYSMIIFC